MADATTSMAPLMSPPGIYSSWLPASFGKARMNPSEPDSIIQQLQALSPDQQNAYATAHAQDDTNGLGMSPDSMTMAMIIAGMGGLGALGTGVAGLGGAAGTGVNFAGQFAASDAAAGAAFGGGGGAAAGAGGLDAIGQMVTQIPEGMTATGYAATQGYPTADAWLSSLGGGAAGGTAGAAVGSSGSGEDAMLQASRTQQLDSLASHGVEGGNFSLTDMLSQVFGGSSSGLLQRAGSALGLPSGVTSAIGPLYNIGTGIYGMMQGEELKKRAAALAAQADPFAQYRPGYAAQLQTLMSDPSSATSLPGYKAGLQAVERRGAAQGWNGSGNMMAALSDYGGNFYNQAIQNLMGLSGANVNPVSAASLGLSGEQAGASISMQGLNRVGYGVTQRDPTSDLITNLLLNRKAA